MNLLEIQELTSKNPVFTPTSKKKKEPIETLFDAHEYFYASVLLGQKLTLNSNDKDSLIKFALCMEARGFLEESLKCYKQLVKIEESPYTLTLLGNCLMNLGNVDSALTVFLDSLLIESSDTSVYFEIYKNIGNIYVRRGDFDLAEDFYNKAYAVNSNSDVLLVNYGTLAIQNCDEMKALEKFRAALGINQKNDKAWVGLALVHNSLGDRDLAWGNLKTALEINPKNKTAVELCCHWSHRDANYKLAIDSLDQYIENSEFESDIAILLIETLVHCGDLERARYEVEKALLWEPQNTHFLRLERAICGKL